MQSAAGNRIRHIGTEFAVGCSGIHICTTSPIAQRIDLRIGIEHPQFFRAGIALTDDKSVTAENILAVHRIFCVNITSNLRKLLLLHSQWHTFENAVVATAQAIFLISRQVCILGNTVNIYFYISCNAVNNVRDRCRVQIYR